MTKPSVQERLEKARQNSVKEVPVETKKARKKVTVADLKAQAEKARARLQALELKLAMQESPEITALAERVRAAQKAANLPNRFIATLTKGIATRRRELREKEAKLAKYKAEKQTAESRLVALQKELEAARAKVGG
jgi:chromosome segregation ATPase